MDDVQTRSNRDRRDLVIGSYYQDGLSNQEIADIVHLSPGEVSRALARLRAASLLQTTITVNYGSEYSWVEEQRRNVKLEEKLQRAFRLGSDKEEQSTKADHIWVVPGKIAGYANSRKISETSNDHAARSEEQDQKALDLNTRLAARFAAEKLLLYLEKKIAWKQPVTIGISWGNTLNLFTEEFVRLHRQKFESEIHKFNDITIFNMTGDLRGSEEIDPNDSRTLSLRYWSSLLATKLAQALKAKRVLCPLPGWIPLGDDLITTEELKECYKMGHRFFLRYDGYKKIFSGIDRTEQAYVLQGLLADADVLITGIGSDHSLKARLKYMGLFSSRDGKPEHPLVKEALTNAVGDISGVVLPKGGYRNRDTREPALTNAFIGPRLRDFKHVWKGANEKESGRLGVLAIAAGAEKAEAVKAALDSYVINQLVIDTSLGDALLQLVEAERRGLSR